MGAFIVAVIMLISSIVLFFYTMLLGAKVIDQDLNYKIYLSIYYLISLILFCNAFVLLGISETYRRFVKYFSDIQYFIKHYSRDNNAKMKIIAEKVDSVCKGENHRITCPHCNKSIVIENDFGEKFFCPYCGVKLSF